MSDKQQSRAAGPKKIPFTHLFRMSHFLLTVSTLVLIVTGVVVHAVARPDWSLIGGNPKWLPDCRAVYHHLLWSLVFAPAIVIGAVELFRARGIGRALKPRWLPNYLLIIGGLLTLVSAFPLLYENRPDWLYHLARGVHAVAGLVIIPLALLFHIFTTVTKRRALLVPVYRLFAQPKWLALLWLPVLGAVGYAALLQVPAKRSAGCELLASRTTEQPATVRDLPWADAPPLCVPLSNGHGFRGGRTELTLKAMYNDKELFMLAEWLDPTEDTQYWPWRKTAAGWKHLYTDFKDETVYYEDKLGFVFPLTADPMFEKFGCAVHCHQSSRMPYGLKGTDMNHPLDVWHWKASRTDPAGYMDDKFWQGRDLMAKEGGRLADTTDEGGYAKNKNEDGSRPKWLPADDGAVRRGAILKEGAVPYTAEAAARYPEGAQIPGIVIARAIGDRGSVRCESHYEDGRWQLFIRRDLDTGSDRDVVFHPGGRQRFACAAFDHCAKRHAYNHCVYTLVLAE
jgi:hypothetical protein